ncbi:hypothetical protein PENSPDRAFT_739695 [Peniophora sp. CONT]|nr:hypothetical protein PENSPDRAFT_739695 [Peniophora sp. CONT]
MRVQLPPELLLQIFLEIQRAHYWIGSEKTPPCCAVSQVCRQWRMIALVTSHLWTYIPLTCLPWANTCLMRSHESCVEVTARHLFPGDEVERQSLILATTELPRTSVLFFSTATNYYGYRELIAEVFAGWSLRPAPKLRELDISITDEVDLDREPIVLPNSLFASRELPSLEKASVESCELTPSWSRIHLPRTLRSLEMNDALAWKNVDEMVQFFELVPELEEFCLHTNNTRTCRFDTALSSRYPRKGLPLSKLQTFEICTRYLEVIIIFAYLSIPSTASIIIEISECDEDLAGDVGEEELLEAICVGLLALQDHFAPVVAAGHGYTDLCILPDGLYSSCMCDCATATRVCICGILPPESWSCFELWASVEVLLLDRFSKHALSGFVAAMHRQGFRLFPSLRHLQIVDATVVEPDKPLRESDTSTYLSVSGEGLRGTNAQEFVAAMKELAGYEQFERLTLTRCAVSTQALQATREMLRSRCIEGDVESPAERLKWREEKRNKEIDWEDPKSLSFSFRYLPDTD